MTREYTFGAGFSIRTRMVPTGVFHAMGDTHVCESNVFDVYKDGKPIGTRDTFDEAKELGLAAAI